MKKINLDFKSSILSSTEMKNILGGLTGGGCSAEALCGNGKTVSCQDDKKCHAVDGPNGYAECGEIVYDNGATSSKVVYPCSLA